MKVFGGIDLGGTASRFVIAGRDEVLASGIVATAELGAGSPAERVERSATAIRDLLPPGATLVGLGVGASGPVDRARGMVGNPDTLPLFSGFPLVAGLQDRLKVPVTIDNDAVVAAIAEQRVGAGKGADRMLMVTLGTGIGVAFLVDGAPFRGSNGAHPEAGHIPIVTTEEACYCGATGCWEQVASRSALQRMLRPLLSADVAPQDLLPRAAAALDQPAVRAAWAAYGALVGRGLAALHTLYMPTTTVLGGSAAGFFDLFRDATHQALWRTPEFTVPATIRPAALGDEAGALGAAIMARDMASGSVGTTQSLT